MPLTAEELLDYFRHYKTIPYFWKSYIKLDFLKEFISLTNVGEERDRAVVFAVKLNKINKRKWKGKVRLHSPFSDDEQELISLGNDKEYIISKLTNRKLLHLSETFAGKELLEELLFSYKEELFETYPYNTINYCDITELRKGYREFYHYKSNNVWNSSYLNFYLR